MLLVFQLFSYVHRCQESFKTGVIRPDQYAWVGCPAGLVTFKLYFLLVFFCAEDGLNCKGQEVIWENLVYVRIKDIAVNAFQLTGCMFPVFGNVSVHSLLSDQISAKAIA